MLQSFRSRLVLGTVLWVIVALVVSFFILSQLFRHQVTSLFNEELKGHFDELMVLAEFGQDGRPRLRHAFAEPRFETPGSGFYWQLAVGHQSVVRSPSLRDGRLPSESVKHSDGHSLVPAIGPAGPLFMIAGAKQIADQPERIEIAIAADERIVEDVVSRFNKELIYSFLVMGAGLIAAAWASITFGLYPLGRIRSALTDIHSGAAMHLPDTLPSEVAPLAGDLNALLDANRRAVQRAKAESGRLAHGLKTPLAIVMAEARNLDVFGAGERGRSIVEQCERMRRQIEFQLKTARAAATTDRTPGTVARLGPSVQDVVVAMSTLYHERALDFTLEGDLEGVIACDPQDLDEVVGNLVDNAAKWARSRVNTLISAGPGTNYTIRIEDDGPGLPAGAIETVFDPGARLDETKPGSGLGLAIVRDVVERYGGRAWIERSAMGGAAACVELPSISNRLGGGGHPVRL